MSATTIVGRDLYCADASGIKHRCVKAWIENDNDARRAYDFELTDDVMGWNRCLACNFAEHCTTMVAARQHLVREHRGRRYVCGGCRQITMTREEMAGRKGCTCRGKRTPLRYWADFPCFCGVGMFVRHYRPYGDKIDGMLPSDQKHMSKFSGLERWRRGDREHECS